ncbi:hypothetical protein BU24DRAFT_219575 [Aaosphaeria arxii CBS 175.79]|uniref:Uncharacterized protein n=1 Tax=Aaosphaeria arxii CBS 175.79 TaxID=1450172 RepID=A0A6A5XNH9_9PLEO|nr:uncharacterized protein BU24DRAFT_219575 [Aaosphaeria arxii CBS 175.79]KAF2014692.1 hypothetical protein BU24DRAFT_219575 [Aaosphaeria arxii CBS 175.79]
MVHRVPALPTTAHLPMRYLYLPRLPTCHLPTPRRLVLVLLVDPVQSNPTAPTGYVPLLRPRTQTSSSLSLRQFNPLFSSSYTNHTTPHTSPSTLSFPYPPHLLTVQFILVTVQLNIASRGSLAGPTTLAYIHHSPWYGTTLIP